MQVAPRSLDRPPAAPVLEPAESRPLHAVGVLLGVVQQGADAPADHGHPPVHGGACLGGVGHRLDDGDPGEHLGTPRVADAVAHGRFLPPDPHDTQSRQRPARYRAVAVFLGDDLLAWLVLALGGALLVGNVAAIIHPPERPREEGALERAPVTRSVVMAAVGFVAAVWALASLVSS